MTKKKKKAWEFENNQIKKKIRALTTSYSNIEADSPADKAC